MNIKRKAILSGIDTEGYLCNDGTSEILAVLTDKQSMNGSVSATVTPHPLTPSHRTPWRRAIVSGDSEEDVIRRYVKAQQTVVQGTVSREDLEGILLKEQAEAEAVKEGYRVSVTSNGVNRNIMYIQPETVAILNRMSDRGDIVSGRVTDDELPAIASLPATDSREGYKMTMSGRRKARAQITVLSENIPAGIYEIDPEETVFEDDLDWFVLREALGK